MLLVCLHHPSGRSLSFWWLCLQCALALPLKTLPALQGMFWCPFQHHWRHPCHRQLLQKKNSCSSGCVPHKRPSAVCVTVVLGCAAGSALKGYDIPVFSNTAIGNFFFSLPWIQTLSPHFVIWDPGSTSILLLGVTDWSLLLMKSMWAVPLVSQKWTLQSRPLTSAGRTRRLLQEKAACTACTLQPVQSEQGRKWLTTSASCTKEIWKKKCWQLLALPLGWAILDQSYLCINMYMC